MTNLEDLTYFLGIEVGRRSQGYVLSQIKYASDILSITHFSDGKVANTPLSINVKLRPRDGTPL